MIKGIKITDNAEWVPLFDIGMESLQEHVGGYFDVLGERQYSIFVNDDGIGQGMGLNWGIVALFGHTLFGPSVITGPADREGNTLPITDAIIRKVIAMLPVQPDQASVAMQDAHLRALLIEMCVK